MPPPLLNVAIPWSLSHYIPLDGFHPLYRALFDYAPDNVKLSAWDNVRLYERLSNHAFTRKRVLQAIKTKEDCFHRDEGSFVKQSYEEHFWFPNQVLTAALEGDLELHHTAPFPSLARPFVLCCESFAPVLFPFAQQGSGTIENCQAVKEHYRGLFSNPLCLGIFSHVPDTLTALSRFLSDPIVDRKLFPFVAGLRANAASMADVGPKQPLGRPRFLFVNSANQNSMNFFHRGGHLVLRFWKKFIADGHDGRLIMRCAKPSDSDLHDYGVDLSWVQAEIGRSIIWDQGYLAGYEMHALMESAHFLLLPSASLHSVSIMEAMRVGTIPVVSDTVGTSVYVRDEENGIVLHGVRKEVWQKDEMAGILVDRYCRRPELDRLVVEQMVRRVSTLLGDHAAYWNMRARTIAYARQQFSGRKFADEFWHSVSDLYAQFRRTSATTESSSDCLVQSLRECTIQNGEWARVFESPTQPMLRIKTGYGTVWELGGAVIHVYENPCINLHDWSVLARYYIADAPRMTFARTLEELRGKYLHSLQGYSEQVGGKLVRWASSILRPFPLVYKYAAIVLAVYRRSVAGGGFFRLRVEPEIELVRQGVRGYNIIRHRDRFYAILQREGEFSPEKAEAGGYSSHYYGRSIEEVTRCIHMAKSTSETVLNGDDSESAAVVIKKFYGFTIVRQGKTFHAHRETAFAMLKRDFAPFTAVSLEEVQRHILSLLMAESTRHQSLKDTADPVDVSRGVRTE